MKQEKDREKKNPPLQVYSYNLQCVQTSKIGRYKRNKTLHIKYPYLARSMELFQQKRKTCKHNPVRKKPQPSYKRIRSIPITNETNLLNICNHSDYDG